jgi:hypothetical protein
MAWSYAFTAQAGPDKADCQDAVVIKEMDDGLAIALSDGAGSAKFGQEAAQLIAQSAVELVSETSGEMLSELKCRLKLAAQDQHPEDFACTLVLVHISDSKVKGWQIGDGGTVLRRADELLWRGPHPNEYMNVTTFVHEASSITEFEIDGAVEALSVFSDGIQHLVIDPISAEVHRPFFDRLFMAPQTVGHDERASAWLRNMALSDPVRKRTDDDIGIAVARWVDG